MLERERDACREVLERERDACREVLERELPG